MIFKKREIEIIERGGDDDGISIEDAGSSKWGGLHLSKRKWFQLAGAAAGLVIILFAMLQVLGGNGRSTPVDIDSVKWEDYSENQKVLARDYSLEEFLREAGIEKSRCAAILEKGLRDGYDTMYEGGKIRMFFRENNKKTPEFVLFEQNPLSFYWITPGRLPGIELIYREVNPYLETEGWVLPEDMLQIITGDVPPKGLNWEAIQQIEDILLWSIGLRNLLKGDTIQMVWQKMSAKGNASFASKYAIMALGIKSQSLDTMLFAFDFKHDGERGFYDMEGRPWKRQFLRSPVQYGRISSRFDLSRLHPILNKIKPHRGTDFAAPEGTEILALADGEIIAQENRGDNGNYVKIRHDSIYSTAYLHMSRFVPGQKVGDRVKQGQVIGYVGQTGSATGPHVCLRFWRRDFQDDFVASFQYMPKPPPLPFELLEQFFARRDSLLHMMEAFEFQ